MVMYIFLDIDGVLNQEHQWTTMYSLHKKCIENFCSFVNKTKGEVVLISSWRPGFVSTKNPDNTENIKELEKELEKYGVYIKDKTPKLLNRSRDKEIERFLYFHPTDEYIVLDDDKREYDEVNRHNYFINSSTGFTKKDIKRALRCI